MNFHLWEINKPVLLAGKGGWSDSVVWANAGFCEGKSQRVIKLSAEGGGLEWWVSYWEKEMEGV